MRNGLLAVFLTVVFIGSSAWAQKEKRAKDAKASKAAKAARVEVDANGDGVVDDAEAQRAAELLMERIAAQVERFRERFDEDGDGKLGAAEQEKLKTRYEASGKQLPASLKGLDANGDWAVTEDEEAAFVQRMVKRYKQTGAKGGKRATAAKQQASKRNLAQDPDTNGDGLIDEEEGSAAVNQRLEMMRAWLPRMKKRAEEQGADKVPAFVSVVDTNGDWELSTAEEEALGALMMTQFQERNELVLKMYDTDGDGKLSGAEKPAAAKAAELFRGMTALIQEQRVMLYGGGKTQGTTKAKAKTKAKKAKAAR